MNVFVRARARTCIRIAHACTLNFQAASRARALVCAYVRSRESSCVGLRGFACVSGLLRVRECRKGHVHRANASRTQMRFLFKEFQDVLYVYKAS